MTPPIDSKTTYEVWRQLIHDEELAAAMFEHRHRESARERGFTGEQLAALEWFHDQPGTRWNLENLRFRTALETAAVLSIHLPRTVLLLTGGNDDWLQDICFEYLSYHRWDSLGHYRLGECRRFATYTSDRIAKRRAVPRHLDAVLELELAIIEVLEKTSDVPAEMWAPRAAPDAAGLAELRPRLAPTALLLEQDIDLRPVLAASPGERVAPDPRPAVWLIHVASLADGHRIKVVGDGIREILVRCTGAATVATIAAELEDELELPADKVIGLLRGWLDDRILIPAT